MSPGDAPAVPAAEVGLSPSGHGTPHRPQPPAQAREGGAGGGARRPLQLPQGHLALGAGLLSSLTFSRICGIYMSNLCDDRFLTSLMK